MMPHLKIPPRHTRRRPHASRKRSGLPARLLTGAALLLGVLLILQAYPASAQGKSLLWERFDVDIIIRKDSSFDVTEHQTIRFTRGTFTYGFRDIPKRNLSSLDGWTLTDASGNSYRYASYGKEPYTFTVTEKGSRYIIYWYFPDITNRSETFSLGYTVRGGLRYYEAGDQLWWKAIYAHRSFPVQAGRVNVVAPASIHEWAAYTNTGEAWRDAREIASATRLDSGREIAFVIDSELAPGQAFEVRVEFTPGVVAGEPQPWQIRADAEAAAREAELRFRARWSQILTLLFGAFGLLFLLGGPAALYLLWYRLGRDKPVEMVADYLPEPPSDLAPGVVGTLLDEQADMQDIIATLVDLAQRKVISITEDNTGKSRSARDFIYRYENRKLPVSSFEQHLLHSLFSGRSDVRLSDLKHRFHREVPALKRALYSEVTAQGFFARSPEKVRNQYAVLGIILLALAGLAGKGLYTLFGGLTGAAALPGIGLAATALGFLLLSRFMPRKTVLGSKLAARWQAFKSYLREIDRFSDLEEQKELWDRWLPYAIAFGLDKQYIRKFEKVKAPAPSWYIPSPKLYGQYRSAYYGTRSPVRSPVHSPGTVVGGGLVGGGMSGLPSGSPGRGGLDGGMGRSLSAVSGGLGSSLSGLSVGLGTMLTSTSANMTSRPSSTYTGGGGWSREGYSGGGYSGGSFGGGFSGGGGFGGG
ncbi:MAG: DUF2207 domain-containing protein, partial [Caldilineaceae bacterium SB0664_bin_27]|nr:DUF2207 domain-containing protein [Caldilineaceae bacterium SB0664_bin_27]